MAEIALYEELKLVIGEAFLQMLPPGPPTDFQGKIILYNSI